ncbi:hypothetical protein [Microtetraspora malaysiensis]|uniref:hypothetical protein n=1 Tax=Microtetraspora malaysiensis TaxID=161358 RepID=UPI000A990ADE|nr:hypothetical protein [Microtetraspora malaysiensis]
MTSASGKIHKEDVARKREDRTMSTWEVHMSTRAKARALSAEAKQIAADRSARERKR